MDVFPFSVIVFALQQLWLHLEPKKTRFGEHLHQCKINEEQVIITGHIAMPQEEAITSTDGSGISTI
jgi:hypothetical protein